jgi:hypothetical protein
LRPSKSTFPPRRAASTASSYLIPVGLPSSVIRGSLPIGLVQGTVTSLAANFAELFFSVNYAATSEATGRITIRSWCISVPDPGYRAEHSGILLRVIHRAHHYASFRRMASPVPTLLVGALLEFLEVHF